MYHTTPYCHSWLLNMYSKQEATVTQSSSTLGVEQVSSLIATSLHVYSLTTGTYKYEVTFESR